MVKNLWTKEELMLAFNLYLKIPFGKMHSTNTDIIHLAGLIDFQDKLTLLENDVEEKLLAGQIVRDATVSMPFLKDIISRYSNYYARQGLPDFNIDEVYKSLF